MMFVGICAVLGMSLEMGAVSKVDSEVAVR